MAEQIGVDGRQLLQALFAPASPHWLRELGAVRILAQVWLQQYYAVGDTEAMHWRQADDQPSSGERIHTPYDDEARYSDTNAFTRRFHEYIVKHSTAADVAVGCQW